MQSITLRNEKSESQTQAGPDSHTAEDSDIPVYFIRELKGRWGVKVLILPPSALGTAPCWGVHLQKKVDEMKRF